MSRRPMHEPEFVSTLELHQRDRLPGWYAIAGLVTFVLPYEGVCQNSIIRVGPPTTGIDVEVPDDLMEPLRHRPLFGAWVVCRGSALIFEDRRSLLASWVGVAEWPDPEYVDPDFDY